MKKNISLLNIRERRDLLDILSSCFVNPKSELDFTTPYELLCAVVLSAQATDKSVNAVTAKLFKVASTPEQMVALGQDKLATYIKSIGLWGAKSSNIIKLSSILIEKYNSIVPSSYEDLISLPGVGSKTAKVVLNVAFNQPTIAVDTHIFRVCNRTGFCVGKTVKEVEDSVVNLVDDSHMLEAHHLLLLHGRYVCKARSPLCNECKIQHLCKKVGIQD